MDSEDFKGAFRPLLPMVDHFSFNDIDSLSVITEETAAVIVEPVQGEGGVQIPAPGFLEALREKCDKTGALLIFDEVQTGFGRTGKMFAFQKYGVRPDILTLAKALGGGMPLGAMVTSPERMSACLEKDWLGDVERKSKKVVDGLKSHPAVKEIRAAGLLIAVDLGREDLAKKVLYLLLDEGVITDWFLFQPTSFRIAPPLCITDEELELGIQAVRRALDKLAE